MLAAAQVHAQSFDQALERAWSRHPQVSAASLRADEARARIAAGQRLTPGASSVSLSQANDRIGSRSGRQEWEVEVASPLWLPGQREAQRAEAEAFAAELKARYTALRLQLAGEVREAWWALVAARQARDVAAGRLSTAGALEDDVLRRFRVGDLSRIDANLAQSERLSARAEHAETQLAVQAAEQNWLRLTGDAAPDRLDGDNGPLAERIRDGHPDLAQGDAAIALARSRVVLAERFTRESPELALRAVRERGDGGEPFRNFVGIKLTLPLTFGPRVRQESSAARAELRHAETELARTRDRLEIELRKAGQGLHSARLQLEAAQLRRQLATDNLHLTERAFTLGEIDLVSLLRVRAAAFDAEAAHRRQQTNHALAESRVRQAAGETP